MSAKRHGSGTNGDPLARAESLEAAGDHAGARALLGEALEADPDNPAVHQAMGLLHFRAGMLDDAVGHLERAAEGAPGVPRMHLNLGVALENRGDVGDAAARYRRAIALDPGYATAFSNLGYALRRLEDYAGALDAFGRALAIDPGYARAHVGLVSILRDVRADTYRDDIAAEITRCLTSPLTSYADLAQAAAAQIELRYGLAEPAPDAAPPPATVIERLAGDPLFMEYLGKCVNSSIAIELFVTPLRRHLLLSHGMSDAGAPAADLAAVLARQCFMNEYVFFREDDEETELGRLAERLGEALAGGGPIDAIRVSLVIYAMYAPLHTLAGSGRLAAMAAADLGPGLDGIVQLTVRDHAVEQGLKDAIETFGAIDDATSRAVRAQYEDNPYPRWLHAPRQLPAPPIEFLRRNFPHFTPPGFLLGRLDILVAGCGTGQHPVLVAMRNADARITAIDLSLSSIAYAMRMAGNLGIENIAFRQGDILAADDIDGTFDVIESIGVLHHMKDPAAGWRALLGRLRPGGLFRIGLYSEKGRRGVVACRDMIALRGYGSTAGDIGAFRRLLIEEGHDPVFERIFGRLDFYSTSMCRDLLFHVQEHRFTLPRIKEMLDDLGLDFIGFEFDDAAITAAYRQHFPDDPAMTDLLSWDRFEDMFPDAIEGYVFWCQKRG